MYTTKTILTWIVNICNLCFRPNHGKTVSLKQRWLQVVCVPDHGKIVSLKQRWLQVAYVQSVLKCSLKFLEAIDELLTAVLTKPSAKKLGVL